MLMNTSYSSSLQMKVLISERCTVLTWHAYLWQTGSLYLQLEDDRAGRPPVVLGVASSVAYFCRKQVGVRHEAG